MCAGVTPRFKGEPERISDFLQSVCFAFTFAGFIRVTRSWSKRVMADIIQYAYMHTNNPLLLYCYIGNFIQGIFRLDIPNLV